MGGGNHFIELGVDENGDYWLSVHSGSRKMSNVYSSSIGESTLDEAPDAYKPAQSIIENIKDTADILHIVKPVYNFKAH